jgi:hypothetical protein
MVFKDLHHILIYTVEDIAFIPIEVLFVTLIIHRLLEYRDKRSKLKKLNMVIGAFYSEIGSRLIKDFVSYDTRPDEIRKILLIDNSWTDRDFNHITLILKKYQYSIDTGSKGLSKLKMLLLEKRSFLLGLLENPNLLEHDSFTDLLWAVFHLTEELTYRKNIDNSRGSDKKHLENDIIRGYEKLVIEWLDYMKHLKEDYPYLFSLAVRTNPFDPNASPEIT